jgi:hypothetical protein
MASADYKLCDVCGNKAFYDADISDHRYVATYDPEEARKWDPIGLAVLCSECNKTHKAVIVHAPKASDQTIGEWLRESTRDGLIITGFPHPATP